MLCCVPIIARSWLSLNCGSERPLGGVESLIEHRASIEGEGSSCPGDLLRLSVGLEDAGELY